jgi:hypothetical protein
VRGEIPAARRLLVGAAAGTFRPCGSDDPGVMQQVLAGTVGGDPAAQAHARAIVDACLATHPEPTPAWALISLMRLHDWQRALDLLASRISSDDAGVSFRIWSPEGMPMRLLPGFPALAEQIGWVDAWEKYGPPDRCTRTAPREYACR